jgi:membrane fusion protein, heavy metal efflux system
VQCQPSGKSMLCIQSKDIIFENGKQYVVIMQPNKQLKVCEVVVDNQQGKYSYISSGIKEGDVLISQNTLLVYNALNAD